VLDVAAAALRHAFAHEIDDDRAHHARRVGEEPAPVVDPQRLDAGQLHVRLVDERRGVEQRRLAVAVQAGMCQQLQFRVRGAPQRVDGRAVCACALVDQPSEFTHDHPLGGIVATPTPGFRRDVRIQPRIPFELAEGKFGRASMVVQSTERRRADRPQGTCRCIVAVMVAAISPLLLANTITVDDASSGSVPGKCTIQDAFVAANTNATFNGCSAGSVGVDTIVFAPGITNIVLADRFPPGFGSYGL
jgi:hypothetical protein